MSICTCSEMRINLENGETRLIRVKPNRYGGHDCEYTKARSALVPAACREADEKVPGGGGWADKKRKAAWSAVFNAAMDRLAAPLVAEYSRKRREAVR